MLANVILFPPHKKNPHCTKQNPDVPCDPTSWSFKVPKKGMYNVKVTSGDASKPFVNSLTVNGTPLFSNVFLQPN